MATSSLHPTWKRLRRLENLRLAAGGVAGFGLLGYVGVGSGLYGRAVPGWTALLLWAGFVLANQLVAARLAELRCPRCRERFFARVRPTDRGEACAHCQLPRFSAAVDDPFLALAAANDDGDSRDAA